MFKRLAAILKEVFWIKKAAPKKKRATVKKVVRKAVKKKAARPQPKPKSAAKPLPKTNLKVKAAPVAKVKAPKQPLIDPSLVETGEITHYFDRIKVCVIKLTAGTVLIGDKLTIVGPKTKFVQKVWSMQIESVDVKVAKKGQLIGIKVEKPVAVGDKVYK